MINKKYGKLKKNTIHNSQHIVYFKSASLVYVPENRILLQHNYADIEDFWLE